MRPYLLRAKFYLMKKKFLSAILLFLLVYPSIAQSEEFPYEYLVPFNPNIYTDLTLILSHRTANYMDFVPPVITEHYRLDNDIDLGDSPIDDIYISITPDKISEWGADIKYVQITFVSRIADSVIRCTAFNIGKTEDCRTPVQSVFGMRIGVIKYVIVITKPLNEPGYRNYIFEIFPKPGGYYHIAQLQTGDQWNVAATASDFRRRFPKALEKLNGDKVMAYLKSIHENPYNYYRKDYSVYSEPYHDYIVYQSLPDKANLKKLFSDLSLFDGQFHFELFGPMYYGPEISKEHYAFKTMFFRKMNGHRQVCFAVPDFVDRTQKKIYHLDCNDLPQGYQPMKVFSPFPRYWDGLYHNHQLGLIAGKQSGNSRLFIYNDYCGKWSCSVLEDYQSEKNPPIFLKIHSYKDFLRYKDSVHNILLDREGSVNW